MLALLLVALSLGATNLAGAIGIGLGGVDARLRVRVAACFALFEAGMPVVGLVIGRQVAGDIGSRAGAVAGGLLIATGAFTIINARGDSGEAADRSSAIRAGGAVPLLVSSAALSVDNLVVGFALGAYRVSVLAAVLIIAATSVGVSLVGLELGHRLGRAVRYDTDVLAGAVLAAVGVAVVAGLL